MFRTKFMSMAAVLAVSGAISMAQAQGTAIKETPATNESETAHAQVIPAKTHAYSTQHAMKARLDLNVASREELMKLRGIGEATADKIIAARPFTSKRELLSKKVLEPKEYQMIAGRVMVKHEPLAASKSHK